MTKKSCDLSLNLFWGKKFYIRFIIGDITQKGYEKKRNKLLQPFVQAVADKAAAEKAAAQQEAATNSSSSSQQQSPEVSTVKAVPAAASAGAAKASRSGSSASGSTVSSTVDQTSGATIITVPGPTAAASAPDQAAAAANKPRSRRTHKRYYNEKRYHSEVSIINIKDFILNVSPKIKTYLLIY